MHENWLKRHWKWIVSFVFISICFLFFFILIGDATSRYTSILLQPELIENARKIANENKEVNTKFGKLQPHNFLNLIEGEVRYTTNKKRVAISIKLEGTRKKGILDVYAQKKVDTWEYDSIAVRIKKPEKVVIPVYKRTTKLSE